MIAAAPDACSRVALRLNWGHCSVRACDPGVYCTTMRSPRELNRELVRRYGLWMVAQHYAVPTQKMYARALTDFCAFIGEKRITRVTHTDVIEFLAHESRRGVSLQSNHNKLNILRVFYDFLNLGGAGQLCATSFCETTTCGQDYTEGSERGICAQIDRGFSNHTRSRPD